MPENTANGPGSMFGKFSHILRKKMPTAYGGRFVWEKIWEIFEKPLDIFYGNPERFLVELCGYLPVA